MSTTEVAVSRDENPEHEGSTRAELTDEIVRALANCDSELERVRLQHELVTVNLPVAESIATRYRSRGVDQEDLRQVAYLALVKAVQRFDPGAGHAFLSFCVPTVRGEVRRHFRDHGWMVRPPRAIQELQQRLAQTRAEQWSALGRPPTAQELAEEVDADPAEVREALDARGCFTPTSLDQPVGTTDGAALGELLGVSARGVAAAEARVVLAPVLRVLSDRDRRILRLRFFEGLTQQEIAQQLGITQMQVSRLLSRIFRDLRRAIGPTDGALGNAS
jgi:RNA polymerase sigma-B factor